MAKVVQYRPMVTATATITLDLDEMRALDALTGYGVDQLIEHFYKHMGKSYLEPYEHGLRSFLKAAASISLRGVDDMQRDLDNLEIERGKAKKPPVDES